MNRPTLSASYDATADVLYLTSRKGARAESKEPEAGLVLRFDPTTNAPVGATLIDYKYHWLNHRRHAANALAKFFGLDPSELNDLLPRS